MYFSESKFPKALHLKTPKVLKSFDKTFLESWILISKSLKGLLPFVFNSWLKFPFESQSGDTILANLGSHPSLGSKLPSRCYYK